METKLKLPHEIITICKVRESELDAFLKRAIAIELFREGLVSIGKANCFSKNWQVRFTQAVYANLHTK